VTNCKKSYIMYPAGILVKRIKDTDNGRYYLGGGSEDATNEESKESVPVSKDLIPGNVFLKT
jgi:hypothetical protein